MTRGFAEDKFSKKIFPSDYFLYLPLLHFSDLTRVFFIPEMRSSKLLVGGAVWGTNGLSKPCFVLGEWDVVLLFE